MKIRTSILVLAMLLSFSASRGTEAAAETEMEAQEEEMENRRGTMAFGTYPQGAETSEPIEWLVLTREDDRMLLLARDCIDSLPWHSDNAGATWEESDIRAWLNESFLQEAFTEEEREEILPSDLNNGDDLEYGTAAGADTQDRVFLLSGAEVERYLPSDVERTVQPTEYAVSQGAYTNGSGNCAWWLRSPGMTVTGPAYIASAGSFGNRAHEADENIIGVRPAVWVKSERMTEVNNVRLSVKEAGNGRDMILIHGRTLSKEAMDPLFAYYSDQYHVVSYDVRGHGKTEAEGEFTLDDLSDDLVELIEAYRLEDPIVIGFSMGSYIALRTAERYPDLFPGIVLIGTRGGRTSSPLPVNDAVGRALESYDNFTDAGKVTVSVLVLTGENDVVNPPEVGQKVAEALPDASFFIVPGAGHMAFELNQDFVTEQIDAYLERLGLR